MGKQLLGFIGLGNMGNNMVMNLINSGYKLAIYDVDSSKMNQFRDGDVVKCCSPKDVADNAEIVMVSLPTPNIVRSVALDSNGIIEGKRIKTYIDLSSTGMEASQRIYEKFNERGINVLDAPVSGGVIGAVNATLTIMVAGNYKIYKSCKSLLNKISKQTIFVDKQVGLAQVMKVINNLLSSSALAITSEAMVLGVKAGLDPDIMIDVLNASSGRNSATEDKFRRSILNRKFDYGFSDTLAYKDMKLCIELSEKLKVPMFLGNNMVHFWRFIVSQDAQDKDYTSVIKYIENWAGVTVESKEVQKEVK